MPIVPDRSEDLIAPLIVEEELTLLDTVTVPVADIQFLPIFFDIGSYQIPVGQTSKLDGHAILLSEMPMVNIKLVGNASVEGSDSDNTELSLMRARSVRQYLILAGVDELRLDIGSRPTSMNSYDDEKELLNRRVDLVVMP